MTFSLLDRWLPFSTSQKLILFHAITSFLTSVVLTAIILWFFLEFGLTVVIFVILSALFSQWLTVFGRNLYWSLWAFYLPLAVLLYYVRKNHLTHKFRYIHFGIIVFILIFIKCFYNGMEYITTTLVMSSTPIIYYGSLNQTPLKKFINVLMTFAVASVLAILVTFLIMCFQIRSVQGHFSDGVRHILYSFNKRTYADPADFPARLTASFEATTTSVITTYLNSVYFDAGNDAGGSDPRIPGSHLHIRYWNFLAIFMIMTSLACLVKISQQSNVQKKVHSLTLVTWFSILAPLSWFIIFKSHSYIHTGMNPIVWQMPFIFFGFALCGIVTKQVLKPCYWKKNKNDI